MEDKTKRVQIDIYDADGVLTETEEAEYDLDGLVNELSQIIAGDGLPVVRDKDEQMDLKTLLAPEKRPLTMAWRVGNVTFHAAGASEDVAMRDLQFRAILPDLLATVKSRGKDSGESAE